MAEEGTSGEAPNAAPSKVEKAADKKREIKGGLPYSTAAGTFKKALDGIIVAERPDRFSGDFMTTVLKVSGGSARQIPPLLKKMIFITSDGTPTDLYSKFKSDSGRGQAALDGLRNAFGELFRRNDFIHRAEANTVRDLIVEVTGLNKNDGIVRMIAQTFEAIRGFADKSGTPSADQGAVGLTTEEVRQPGGDFASGPSRAIGLSYHINVVLPETENIAVFNAIFRSLRENLL